MRFGVVVFPGSNCDHDAWYAVSHNLGHSAEFIWHDSTSLGNVDAVILPGGFSYGDYLRCGAIAKFSPVMAAVKKFAPSGGLVLGICNGFQILVESGLLPGALLRNRDLKFVCRPVDAARRNHRHSVHVGCDKGPTDHAAGRARRGLLLRRRRHARRVRSARIAWCCGTWTIPTARSTTSPASAARGRNVMGMMPHPERAADALLGSTDGRVILESMVHSLVGCRAHE